MEPKYTCEKEKKQNEAAISGLVAAEVPAALLAESVNDLANYLKSLIDMLHEQVDIMTLQDAKPARIQASGNICVLLHCADRYLADMRQVCERVQEGGAA